MAKPRFWSSGATLLVVGLVSGCNAPDGDKDSVTQVQSAVTSTLFGPYVAYPTGSSPQAVAIGDLDGDEIGRAHV
jgi:hypothetical protein